MRVSTTKRRRFYVSETLNYDAEADADMDDHLEDPSGSGHATTRVSPAIDDNSVFGPKFEEARSLSAKGMSLVDLAGNLQDVAATPEKY